MPIIVSRGAGSAGGFGLGGASGPAFIEATGGTITESGDYKIHTFTGPGTFTVTNGGKPTGSNSVDYLVIGGGGGGRWQYSAGAGAGGYRESKSPTAPWTASPLASSTSLPVLKTAYPITVGAGGSAVPQFEATPGGKGSDSIFSSITSTGGGAGGGFGYEPGPTYQVGVFGGPGGSGGGGALNGNEPGAPFQQGAAGSGNTPPTSPPQGQSGGLATVGVGGQSLGGAGGGGASQAGQPTPSVPAGGKGGDGTGTAINPAVGVPGPSPSLKYFAGGGGGGAEVSPAGPAGGPGLGGGGSGAPATPSPNNSGTANTGGGSGSGAANGTGTGGSGIVVIRYKFQ